MNRSYKSINTSTDEALVLRIQQGDREAFTQFYKLHQTTMYLAAYHLLRDEEEANDILQELFSDVWQRADRIDIKGNIKGYLYTLLRNRILTGLNRKKHFEEYIDSYLAYERQSVCNTDETILVRELEDIFREKINKLPPKMREVYELSWYDQLSNREIAVRMNISEGTVKQHKHQALRILRSKLQRLVSILFFY